MSSLRTKLRRYWPRIVVALISAYALFYHLRDLSSVTILPQDISERNATYLKILVKVPALIAIAFNLQRIYVGYKPSTRAAEFAFNIWLIATIFCVFFMIGVKLMAHFIPRANEITNNTTAEAALCIQSLPGSLPDTSTLETVWYQIKFWIPFIQYMLLGLGLKTILNRTRRLELEAERRQEEHGYFLATNKDLPTPVASASSVEGFKTEAEMRRLRLRVPTWPRLVYGLWSLALIVDGVSNYQKYFFDYSSALDRLISAFYMIQSVGGLYVLYSKSLVYTRWFFYSMCVTTLHYIYIRNVKRWNEADQEYTIFSLEEKEPASKEEIMYHRVFRMITDTTYCVFMLWVVWRLVTDLKARDARMARAIEIQERVQADEKLLDDVVTEAH